MTQVQRGIDLLARVIFYGAAYPRGDDFGTAPALYVQWPRELKTESRLIRIVGLATGNAYAAFRFPPRRQAIRAAGLDRNIWRPFTPMDLRFTITAPFDVGGRNEPSTMPIIGVPAAEEDLSLTTTTGASVALNVAPIRSCVETASVERVRSVRSGGNSRGQRERDHREKNRNAEGAFHRRRSSEFPEG